MRWIDRFPGRRRVVPMCACLVAIFVLLRSGKRQQPGPAELPRTSGFRNVIVLDAAHGGDDSGAHLENASEKDVTLALSVRLRSLLAARGFSGHHHPRVRRCRRHLVTARRSPISAGAQACLSLHATRPAPAFIFSRPRLRLPRPRAFPHGRPHKRDTSRAAWHSQASSILPFSRPGFP